MSPAKAQKAAKKKKNIYPNLASSARFSGKFF